MAVSDSVTSGFVKKTVLPTEVPLEVDDLEEVARKLLLEGDERGQLVSRPWDESMVVKTLIKGENMEERLIPSLETLMLFCDHYKKKYGLEILCLNATEALGVLKERKGVDIPFAMIILEAHSDHVVPVYCHRSQKDSQMYVLIMNSIDHLESPSQFSTDLLESKMSGVVPMFNIGQRQVSLHGCKVDALSVLKYTHFVLGDQKVTHIPDFITDVAPSELSEEESSMMAYQFPIPSCFAIGAQKMGHIATDPFDSIVVNRKREQAKALRAKYIEECDVEYTIESYEDTGFKIVHSVRKEVRCFLVSKEVKMVAKAALLKAGK